MKVLIACAVETAAENRSRAAALQRRDVDAAQGLQINFDACCWKHASHIL